MNIIKGNLFFMKATKLFMLALFTGLFIVSCQHAPKANDEEVKKKAIESAINIFYTKFNYIQKAALINAMRGDQEADKKMKMSEYFVEGSFLNDKNEKLIPVIDSSLKAGNITIENIKVENRNNELKKCECSADLIIGTLSYKVSYIAQYTEDGKLIVETQLK